MRGRPCLPEQRLGGKQRLQADAGQAGAFGEAPGARADGGDLDLQGGLLALQRPREGILAQATERGRLEEAAIA